MSSTLISLPLTSLLESKFGFRTFRPHQEEVCRKIIEGKDVLLVMPTGAGKSLCYQLPAIARGGTTIVVSPLLALIEDQVDKLKKLGFAAERIHSGRKREDSRRVCFSYLEGKLDFLFIAPERFSVPGFVEMLKKRTPSLIAIDEAHCISQWGHDFRPDYRLLGERITDLRPAPVVALTATATPLVQDDISKQLKLIQEVRSIHGFRRKNIGIRVVELAPSDRPNAVQAILKQEGRVPAIIYAPTRKSAEELYVTLKPLHKVGIYHAGMVNSEREQNQTRFLAGELDVIVATIAFGMGIDKSNIRTVIHTALPSSVEGYYQEIGRAGRDGKDSEAFLLHSYADQRTHDFFFDKNYPEARVLRKVFQQLTEEKIAKPDLRQKIKEVNPEMDDDLFDKVIEKLWALRGAIVDFEENISVGIDSWEKIYFEQRNHKQLQTRLMVQYTESNQCRMLSLIGHFGDQNDTGGACEICDYCLPPAKAQSFQNLVQISKIQQQVVAQILAILAQYEYRAAGRIYEDVTQHNRDLQRAEFEKLLQVLSRAKWIDVTQETFQKDGQSVAYRKVSATALGHEVKAVDIEELQILGQSKSAKAKSRKRSKPAEGPRESSIPQMDSEEYQRLVASMKAWRLGEARKKGVPAFRILSDRVLYTICETKPKSEAGLLQVKGLGPTLIRLYGQDVLRILSN